MSRFERESMLVEPVSRYVSRRSFTRLEAELQFYERRIDLYGFSAKLGLTVAIELKLFKWRQALKQALLYQLCADLVYIAVPKETVQSVDIGQLQAHGIGLIGVSVDRCREVRSPATSQLVRPHYRDFYLEYLGCST